MGILLSKIFCISKVPILPITNKNWEQTKKLINDDNIISTPIERLIELPNELLYN